jgi:addiction module HigA family antidote
MTTATLPPVHPGEMLVEEFLRPLGLSQTRLAKETGLPLARINQICLGQRAITAETDLRLCRYFGLSEGWWLRLQAQHDLEVAKRALGSRLSKECRRLPHRDGHLVAV